jgi:hypothetical protein
MDGPSAPPELTELGEARARARAERDWTTADELRARIEAAGWRVIDHGTDFELRPAHPPDDVADGRRRYGALVSVPSRLDEAAVARASYVVVATSDGVLPQATLEALERHGGADTQVVAVVDGEAPEPGPAHEVVRTVEAFPPADAVAAGMRRACGHIIVVLEPEVVPAGELLPAIESALADPDVAVVGGEGLVSHDMHRYTSAAVGDVTTVGSGCYAFRRADAAVPELLEGRLFLRRSVAAWIGLALRDRGPDERPRRAVALELPLRPREDERPLPDDHARLARRDSYRIARRFRRCGWLRAGEPAERDGVGERAERDGDDDDGDEGRDATPA